MSKVSKYIDCVASTGEEREKKPYKREDCIWISKTGEIFFVGYTGEWMVWAYQIRTYISAIDECFVDIRKLIEQYVQEEKRFLLDCPSSCDYYFEENGFIKKPVSIDAVTAGVVKEIYKESLANNEFPTQAQLVEKRKKINEHLEYCGKAR